MITTRAENWAKLHLIKWLKLAYEAELAAVGDTSQKTTMLGDATATPAVANTWKDTLIGIAEVAQTSKVALAAAAKAQLDADTRW